MKDRIDPNPIIKRKFRVPNPTWNGSDDNQYIYTELDAEVLTLHLNNGMMRVRYEQNGKIKTEDISNQPFFDKYSILEK